MALSIRYTQSKAFQREAGNADIKSLISASLEYASGVLNRVYDWLTKTIFYYNYVLTPKMKNLRCHLGGYLSRGCQR